VPFIIFIMSLLLTVIYYIVQRISIVVSAFFYKLFGVIILIFADKLKWMFITLASKLGVILIAHQTGLPIVTSMSAMFEEQYVDNFSALLYHFKVLFIFFYMM